MGVRLCAKSHIRKPDVTDREYYVEIGYHYPKKRFYVEVAYTYLDERGTYAGMEHFATSIDECIAWIEKEFNVKVTVDGPKIAQEAEWLRELNLEKKRGRKPY